MSTTESDGDRCAESAWAGSSSTPALRRFLLSKKFLVPPIFSLLLSLAGGAVWLFRPSLPYTITSTTSLDSVSDDFLAKLQALSDAMVHPNSSVQLYIDGPQFYEAQLAAIRAAEKTVNLENYIIQSGKIAQQFRDALAERARAGVAANIVADAIGSKSLSSGFFESPVESGGSFASYHPPRWRIARPWHR